MCTKFGLDEYHTHKSLKRFIEVKGRRIFGILVLRIKVCLKRKSHPKLVLEWGHLYMLSIVLAFLTDGLVMGPELKLKQRDHTEGRRLAKSMYFLCW